MCTKFLAYTLIVVNRFELQRRFHTVRRTVNFFTYYPFKRKITFNSQIMDVNRLNSIQEEIFDLQIRTHSDEKRSNLSGKHGLQARILVYHTELGILIR